MTTAARKESELSIFPKFVQSSNNLVSGFQVSCCIAQHQEPLSDGYEGSNAFCQQLVQRLLNKAHKPKSSGALTTALQEKYKQPGQEEKAKNLMKFRV